MSAPELVDEETLTCEQCGQAITGKAKGAGSAAWKLGTHMRVKHGVQGRGRKKRGTPSEAEHEAHPVLSAAREAAADIGIGKKGTPTAEELAAGLGKGLHIATMSAATWAATTDPTIDHSAEGDAFRNLIIDDLTLDMEAAKGVMTPIGRVFSGTRINKRYGRGVVDNVDVLGSLFDLAMLMREWRAYFDMRASRIATIQAANPHLAMAPAPSAVDTAGPATHQGAEWVPGPSEGRVLSAEDIEALRARRAG